MKKHFQISLECFQIGFLKNPLFMECYVTTKALFNLLQINDGKIKNYLWHNFDFKKLCIIFIYVLFRIFDSYFLGLIIVFLIFFCKLYTFDFTSKQLLNIKEWRVKRIIGWCSLEFHFDIRHSILKNPLHIWSKKIIFPITHIIL